MSMTTVELTPRIGTEVKVDQQTLLNGAIAADLRALLEQRGVLIFRGANLDDDQQLAFAKTLGDVRQEFGHSIMKITFDLKENPDYADYFHGTFSWHMDGTHDDVPPLASILSPRVLAPEGGQTEFTNTYAAYEDLSDEDKALLENLKVVHTKVASMSKAIANPTEEQLKAWRSYAPKIHPIVWTHRSGRKSLALSASAEYIVGMERAESDALLARLMDWATQRHYVYQHQWQLGDVLMWDNTGTLHRVLPFDKTCGRKLHRVTLLGEESLSEAA